MPFSFTNKTAPTLLVHRTWSYAQILHCMLCAKSQKLQLKSTGVKAAHQMMVKLKLQMWIKREKKSCRRKSEQKGECRSFKEEKFFPYHEPMKLKLVLRILPFSKKKSFYLKLFIGNTPKRLRSSINDVTVEEVKIKNYQKLRDWRHFGYALKRTEIPRTLCIVT